MNMHKTLALKINSAAFKNQQIADQRAVGKAIGGPDQGPRSGAGVIKSTLARRPAQPIKAP